MLLVLPEVRGQVVQPGRQPALDVFPQLNLRVLHPRRERGDPLQFPPRDVKVAGDLPRQNLDLLLLRLLRGGVKRDAQPCFMRRPQLGHWRGGVGWGGGWGGGGAGCLARIPPPSSRARTLCLHRVDVPIYLHHQVDVHGGGAHMRQRRHVRCALVAHQRARAAPIVWSEGGWVSGEGAGSGGCGGGRWCPRTLGAALAVHGGPQPQERGGQIPRRHPSGEVANCTPRPATGVRCACCCGGSPTTRLESGQKAVANARKGSKKNITRARFLLQGDRLAARCCLSPRAPGCLCVLRCC